MNPSFFVRRFTAQRLQYRMGREDNIRKSKILECRRGYKKSWHSERSSMVKKLIEQGTHIISEIEFCRQIHPVQMICITGVRQDDHYKPYLPHFKDAGYDVGLAGNIGRSLALQIAEEPHEYYVIELSSSSSTTTCMISAQISLFSQTSPPTILDRYDNKFEKYVDAKMQYHSKSNARRQLYLLERWPSNQERTEKFDVKSSTISLSLNSKKGQLSDILEKDNTHSNSLPRSIWSKKNCRLRVNTNIYNSLAAGIASNISGIKKREYSQKF